MEDGRVIRADTERALKHHYSQGMGPAFGQVAWASGALPDLGITQVSAGVFRETVMGSALFSLDWLSTYLTARFQEQGVFVSVFPLLLVNVKKSQRASQTTSVLSLEFSLACISRAIPKALEMSQRWSCILNPGTWHADCHILPKVLAAAQVQTVSR